ncbi:MAG: SDR family oxidoreductase [Burkholderiales bacterium]|nr:MAG: SDR family oxidoreductase [Burkholderiales bacterium]
MNIQDAVVLVTGANRGLGLAFAKEALARGARKVYAGARDPDSVTLPGVIPVRLDVTKPDEVAAAASQLGDVSLLINNAGIGELGSLLHPDAIDALQRHMNTNVVGVLRMAQAFTPVLAAQGGGAMINVLSIVSWFNSGFLPTYAISKSAAWSLTNGLRNELRAQGTQVLGLHMGFVDTDLVRDIQAPKTPPELIVTRTLDALAAGRSEVLGDDVARQIKQGLSADDAFYLQPPA